MNRNVKLKNLSMLDTFEVQGYWWLPGEKTEIAGTLYSDSTGIYLETIDFGELFDDDRDYGIIHGFTVKGEEVTLLRNFIINQEFNMPGISYQKFFCNYFIVGANISDINTVLFKSVNVYSTYLTKWFDSRPYFTEDNTGPENKGYTTHFSPPEIVKNYLSSIGAEIRNSYKWNYKDSQEGTYSDYKESFTITPDQWQTFEWYEDKINGLNRLITLLIGEAILFEDVVFDGEDENLGSSENPKIRPKKYHLFLNQGDVKIKDKMSSNRMIFTYRDISHKIGEICNNWFLKEKELGNVFNLYFSDFFNGKADLENKFLNGVQTLEVYHRALGYGKIFDDEVKEQNIHIINEALEGVIEEDILTEVNKKIKHLNEYSLNKRLKNIFCDLLHDDITKHLFISNKKAKSFANRVVETRNYLTHYDEEGKENKFEGIELYYANELLKVVAGVLLFKESGIDEEAILMKIKGSHKLSQTIPQSKSELKIR
ncbi:hypothetical protein J0K78_05015 [Halobacillus sp. GSS1]|uniref:ApeA N-terminal domain 1-containing protein n=1 Tax=Halobacillus sp. GSS1 TaxID=2815919 RepID=UPI001A8C2252|nr:HEPN domain-containing protein [Halobacillus sp. GSS1]MBN9653621.1 hypothetical protein [Halobacillus sp. GSS1]